MNKCKLLLFFAATAFCFLPFSVAFAGNKSTMESALQNLEQKNKPVFFVSLFDGDFPIPTRFEIYPNGYKRSGRVRFVSPSTPLTDSDNLSQGGLSDNDRIEIGDSRKFIQNFGGSGSEKDIKKIKCYGLQIESTPGMHMKGVHGQNVQISAVLIHNEAQYIVLVGTDGSLWKQLLSVYGALSGKNKGPTCPIYH